MADLEEIMENVALANRMLYEMELADASTIERGHVSYRLPDDPDKFVIKGLGPALSQTYAEHMVVVNTEGFKISGPPEMNLPNEVKMHSCLLRERAEINSVVHVHPRYTVLMSVLQEQLGPMCIEGMPLFVKGIPMFESPRLIIHEKDGAEVAALMGESDAIMLQGHGAATVGADMEEAMLNMLHLEEQAKMNYLAFCAIGRDHAVITPDQREEFVANMRSMSEAEHLKPELAPTPRKPSGIWAHYAEMAGD
jgi:ribulose-5-phosphate 4-epimerase/fuculose-1-phosphate aldolase